MINVNITTYPKRDKYLYKMLQHFIKQTLKPDRIILWLCYEEYDINNLPNEILKCKEFITDIMWCKKNIYCHKRYEVFKYYNDDYNIMIDDDTYYPITFIEELINHCINTHNITCYYSFIDEFTNTSKKRLPLTKDCDKRKIAIQGSSICWPPKTFPIESYEYCNIRDKICKKCDETWLTLWIIKNNILIDALYDFLERIKENNRLIDDADDIGLHHEVYSKTQGIKLRQRMFATGIEYFKINEKVLSIYPNFDIKKCVSVF